MKDDRDIAEELFGSVTSKKIKATGGHKINFARILKPFEWDQAVIRAFCEACGIYVELNREIAERYSYSADIELSENPGKYYFHTTGCALCDSPASGVKLVPIPDA
jgi:hypothetical protein